MTFANEFTSEADVEGYGLDELIKSFRPFSWREGRPSTFVHAWTVDRERDAFFIPVKAIEELGSSGRPEPTQKKICILRWKGKDVRVTIDRAGSSSSNFSDRPFRIIWLLEDLDMSQLQEVSRDEALELLKDALRVYGHHGAHNQATGTSVEFGF